MLKEKFLFLLLLTPLGFLYGQEFISVSGSIRDAQTDEVLPFVSVSFEGSKTGTFTDSDGAFRLSNRQGIRYLNISMLGYRSKRIHLSGTQSSFHRKILLERQERALNDVVIRPKRERYRKKDNPAVELIKKVIERKAENRIEGQDFYRFDEYNRLLIALLGNQNVQSDKHEKPRPLLNYADTSVIDGKLYLPVSVRENSEKHFFRKNPESKRTIITGHKNSGIDDIIRVDGLDEILDDLFSDISIYDNSIRLFEHGFVSPLSKHRAVNFYRWYLTDTLMVDTTRCIRLDYIPFNARDVGFSGSLYIADDGSYAVKRSVLRFSKKMNVNLINEFFISSDFVKTAEGIWRPEQQQMAVELALLSMKFYVQKDRRFSNFSFDNNQDESIHEAAPLSFATNYEKQSESYWSEQRKNSGLKPDKANALMEDMSRYKFVKAFFNAGRAFSLGYFSLSKDPRTAKFEIGTIPSFYSYNSTEGNRIRLTLGSTRFLHPHFYIWGYGAYGTKDKQFKYTGELTWAFNKVQKVKDEYPYNKLVLSYAYDVHTLGQHYSIMKRDNILMSLKPSQNDQTTYLRNLSLSYDREFHGGFSFRVAASSTDERPAQNVRFEKTDSHGTVHEIPGIRLTRTSFMLRYGHNEQFTQHGRRRHSLSTNRFSIQLTHNIAHKNILGGEHAFHNTKIGFWQEQRIPPLGRFMLSVEAERFWGEAPYIFLPTPSANNSFAIQRGSYNLINPLEFIHDTQIRFDIDYRMGGWFFNRIPLLKQLKWREVFGFRGFYGQLSPQNNPQYNPKLLLFPQHSYTTRNGVPYLEYNVGIENIFMFLRIDYVQRLNYLEHPLVQRYGFRFSLNFHL